MTVTQEVEYILKEHKNARNSDKALLVHFMQRAGMNLSREQIEMNWLQRKLFKVRTGTDIVDLGLTKEYVIRFKDIYISVLEGEDDYGVSWSGDVSMSHVPVRDFWTAHKPARRICPVCKLTQKNCKGHDEGNL